MIKIALSAGHNVYSPYFDSGAIGNGFKESECTKQIVSEMIKLFSNFKDVEIYDVTPYNMKFNSSKEAHIERANRVNKINPHMYFDVHMNSASADSTGCEVWLYNDKSKMTPNGKRIVEGLSKGLNIANRGIKYNSGYWSLSMPNCPSMIVETMFISNPNEMKKYDYKKISKILVESIMDKEIPTSQNSNSHNCNCKYHGVVNCDVLNVRNKSNTSDSEIIGQLKKNDKVNIIEKENNWYKIIYENHVAYASADYIKLDEEVDEPIEKPIEDDRVLWYEMRKYDSDVYYSMLDPKTQDCVITKGNSDKFEKPSTIKTINGKEVEVISNLGFFSWETWQESLGIYLNNGTCDSYNSSSYFNFGLTYDGKFNIFYYKDKLSDQGIDDLKKVYKWIASAPIQLIKDRKIDVQYKDNDFKDICNCIAPRTAIGCFKDGRVILICIDGRNKNSKGVTCQELAKIGYDLGLYQMVSVDGGGSSVLVCKGKIINKPSDGNERAVGSMIAFVKK